MDPYRLVFGVHRPVGRECVGLEPGVIVADTDIGRRNDRDGHPRFSVDRYVADQFRPHPRPPLGRHIRGDPDVVYGPAAGVAYGQVHDDRVAANQGVIEIGQISKFLLRAGT